MKRKVIHTAGIGFILMVLFLSGGLLYVTTALPDVGPPPELKVAITPAQIARGQYLANHVAVCMDCHSRKECSPFPRAIAEGLGGGGEIFSR
jgi:hypothetical protein